MASRRSRHRSQARCALNDTSHAWGFIQAKGHGRRSEQHHQASPTYDAHQGDQRGVSLGSAPDDDPAVVAGAIVLICGRDHPRSPPRTCGGAWHIWTACKVPSTSCWSMLSRTMMLRYPHTPENPHACGPPVIGNFGGARNRRLAFCLAHVTFFAENRYPLLRDMLWCAPGRDAQLKTRRTVSGRAGAFPFALVR